MGGLRRQPAWRTTRLGRGAIPTIVRHRALDCILSSVVTRSMTGGDNHNGARERAAARIGSTCSPWPQSLVRRDQKQAVAADGQVDWSTGERGGPRGGAAGSLASGNDGRVRRIPRRRNAITTCGTAMASNNEPGGSGGSRTLPGHIRNRALAARSTPCVPGSPTSSVSVSGARAERGLSSVDGRSPVVPAAGAFS